MQREEAHGAYNLCAPEIVNNAAFTRALAAALHRPAFLAVPAFALKALLGEMAREMLLAGQFVSPARLLAEGFAFSHARLQETLEQLFGNR